MTKNRKTYKNIQFDCRKVNYKKKNVELDCSDYINAKILDANIEDIYVDKVKALGTSIARTKLKYLAINNSAIKNSIIGPRNKIENAYIGYTNLRDRTTILKSSVKKSIVKNLVMERGLIDGSYFKKVAFIDTIFVLCYFQESVFEQCSFSGCAFIRCNFKEYKSGHSAFFRCDFGPKTNLGAVPEFAGQYPSLNIKNVFFNVYSQCIGNMHLNSCKNTELFVYNKEIPVWCKSNFPYLSNNVNYTGNDRLIINGTNKTVFNVNKYNKSNAAYRFYTSGAM